MCGSEIDIVHSNVARSYRTQEQDQILSYMGTRPDRIIHGLRWRERKRKKKRGSPMRLRSKVKSEHNTVGIPVHSNKSQFTYGYNEDIPPFPLSPY